jgi:hypothetical protein
MKMVKGRNDDFIAPLAARKRVLLTLSRLYA